MDKKKKTIVIAVFVVFMSLIVFLMTSIFYTESEEVDGEFSVTTPEVDETKFDSISKLKGYNDESMKIRDSGGSLVDEVENVENEDGFLTDFNPFKRRETSTIDSAAGFSSEQLEQQQMEQEFLEMIRMQEELMAESNAANGSSYPSGGYETARQPAPYPTTELDSTDLPDKKPTLAELRKQNDERDTFFQGATGELSQTRGTLLIPGETVDQGILTIGSTVAILTKEAMRLSEPAIIIPKGAIIYGKAGFGGLDRLTIDIESYKIGAELYPISLEIYDFDGRPGIHLGNNSWPKIPSKVAKEVVDYVKQRGTQNSTFGGQNTGIDLDEAKQLGLLATVNEVTQEVLDKKRVFMPRKYHLWINVNVK
ncbi:conjugative transposon protein TraM [Aggregatimonas sangjinii]|uniref:Conjugative transposon protein TraM n=1 Tax=Aggregatimonas sangjinii TaxID=2583587 RepID=A0A5B7STK3_9FLAO|nr:conjugative transposon protein TraM [Aggregatimonas sangjinii]QCX00669.1 conjugative transposon protein TraM [Aggregatimonas sangjinii]